MARPPTTGRQLVGGGVRGAGAREPQGPPTRRLRSGAPPRRSQAGGRSLRALASSRLFPWACKNGRRGLLEGQPSLHSFAAQTTIGLVFVAAIRGHQGPHGGMHKRPQAHALFEPRDAFVESSGLRMPASRHHQRRIDSGSGDGFGDKRISALIKRPSNAPRRLGGKQRYERRRFFGKRPRQEPVPSLIGVNENYVDVLNHAQRAPARFDSESEQRALTNEAIGSLAGAMQDK